VTLKTEKQAVIE